MKKKPAPTKQEHLVMKITLDTKLFKKQVRAMKRELRILKKQFKSIKIG